MGGRTAAGDPCKRLAGGERCYAHTEEALDEQAGTKSSFLEAFEETLILSDAAKEVGVSYVTIWRMRQADEDFDRKLAALEERAVEDRYQALEDSGFKRCNEGKAPASLHIFYLVNESRRRGDGRWRNTQHVEQSSFPVDLALCSKEELKLLSEGHDIVSVFARTRGLNTDEPPVPTTVDD